VPRPRVVVGLEGWATLERQWRWCPGRSGGVARGRGKANEQTGGWTDNTTRLGGGGLGQCFGQLDGRCDTKMVQHQPHDLTICSLLLRWKHTSFL
jgi:hypothetical protein